MQKIKDQQEKKPEFSDNLKIHLLKALDADPMFSLAHFQLALIYQENGDLKEAETHFREAIHSDSKQIREIERHGEKLLKKSQFQNANFLYMKAHNKKNHCSRVDLQLSDLYEKQGKLSKATTCLKNSITLNPASSKAHRNLGILLSKQKIYDVARIHIEKALELDYSDFLSHLNLGLILKQNEKFKEAELHFLIALDINPKYVICMLEIAHLHMVMKNKMKAKKFYKKAREISPDISCEDMDKALK